MAMRQYFGYRVRQRIDTQSVQFFIFNSRVKDLKQWAGIRRSKDFPEGTQRILRKARKRAVRDFLKSDPINTIPNNVLLAFEPGIAKFTNLSDILSNCIPETDISNGCGEQLEWGVLSFEFEFGVSEDSLPAMIVDGQHRLYGMAEFIEEDIPVLAVCLIDASPQEQAFQFIVINNKAVKVNVDNVKSIIKDIDDGPLRERLGRARIHYGKISPTLGEVNDAENSPFRNLLDWDYNRQGVKLVPLTAIEQSLVNLKSTFKFLEEDEDSRIEIFFAMWNAVRVVFPELWGKDDNKLMKKVSVNALNEFMVERLRAAWNFGMVDIFDPKKVQDQVAELIRKIPPRIWVIDWAIEIQDNANVRNLIKADLGTIIDNYNLGQFWGGDLKLPKQQLREESDEE